MTAVTTRSATWEVSGRPVTLIWERRRLVCEPCGSRFSEGHQGFEGRVTARLARRLVKDARAMTVNAAAKRALRNQAGTSGSDSCDGLSLAWLAAGGEQDAQSVVAEVAEASC